MTVQYGNMPTGQMRVFYTGTDTLHTGYALCYDADTNNDAANVAYATAKTAVVPNRTRLHLVAKPAAAAITAGANNMYNFAGVVDQESDGAVGPCVVTINLPGYPATIYAAFTTVVNNTKAVFVAGQYYFVEGGLPGAGCATTLQTVVGTTSTPLQCQALLDSGPQCGGHGSITAVTGAITAAQQLILDGCGVVYYEAVTIASANHTATLADGWFHGQRKTISCGTQTTKEVDITITKHTVQCDIALNAGGAVASEHIFLETAGEGINLVWDNYLDTWIQLAMTADVATD